MKITGSCGGDFCIQSKSEPIQTMSQKEVEKDGTTAVESAVSGEVPRPLSPHRTSTILFEGEADINGDEQRIQSHVKVGNLYEMEHIHLPIRAPVQLRSIRVAMVCEKRETTVAVRYPSMESLRAFFNYSTRETHPALDKKFVMGATLADMVLVRLVPKEVFSEQKNAEAFWLTSSESFMDEVSVTRKKGTRLSELKGNEMLRWGIRRKVKYLGRHKKSAGSDVNAQNTSSSFVNGLEETHLKLGGVSQDKQSTGEQKKIEGSDNVVGGHEQHDDVDRQENNEGEEDDEGNGDDSQGEEDGDEDDEVEEKTEKSDNILKRKRYPFRDIGVKKPKKNKVEIEKGKKQKKSMTTKSKGRTRFRETFAPKDRWSTERYKLAEKNLLNVMKTKGATAEKPIMRPQLRAEARKMIGDTGLLDHLLKHMAGKLAPGGVERFRRRHNPDGAMEYWLESAELVNIRKEAGVSDPYWVPPLGWMPGDSPTQDPICARELKLLREDISKIKRDIELLAKKTQLEEEIENLRRELASKKRKEENHAPFSMVEKTAKIERLKSGFKLCKPQGTFLWPNMVKDNSTICSSSSNNSIMSPQVAFQVDVPTPPSVSSSTLHHSHLVPPLVKPVAEKRAVTLTRVSIIQNNDDTTGPNKCSSINLNDDAQTLMSSPTTASTQPCPSNSKECCPTSPTRSSPSQLPTCRLVLSPAPEESSKG